MSDPQLTYLDLARTPFEAKVIAGVLLEAGIPAYIAGQHLADEWAITQAMMNTRGVRIQVPAELVDKAMEVIAAAQSNAKDMEARFDEGKLEEE